MFTSPLRKDFKALQECTEHPTGMHGAAGRNTRNNRQVCTEQPEGMHGAAGRYARSSRKVYTEQPEGMHGTAGRNALNKSKFSPITLIPMTKVIVFSAPSGSGKSTLVNYLIEKGVPLHFSISCTSRPPRGTEKNGVEYFFITPEEFRQHINAGDFLEYEEVYEGRFYGTLSQQVDRQLENGENVICDVDVKGGINIKKHYGTRALSVFIQPPSVEVLRQRLEGRGTDTPETIQVRLNKAEYEMSFANQFDTIIVNDDLETAKAEILKVVTEFLAQ